MNARSGSLDVFLYDTHVAVLTSGTDEIAMMWEAAASDRWGVGSRVLSDLLPIGLPGEGAISARVRVFLSGLLAEGNLREHLAFEAGVAYDDVFGLMAHYGRDTAGALAFMPHGEVPGQGGHWEPATNETIAERLRAADRFSPDALESNSLAGVQPKIVLRAHEGQWYRCLAGAPSTHIIKLGHPADSRLADVIDTEAAALELARRVGLTTIEAQVTTFDDVRALVVPRYDRVASPDGSVSRLHQEDSAQALGINTDDMNRKFQRGKTLPSLKAIARLLRNGGSEPDRLLALTTLNLAIGNTDAHAKNISLLRRDDGTAQLAPAYDIAMHGHHGSTTGLFAMDVNGRWEMSSLSADDLLAEAQSWPLPAGRARRVVAETLEGLRAALEDVDRARHPGVSSAAWKAVVDQTQRLLASLAAIKG